MTDYSELIAECLARFEGHDYNPDGPTVCAWHVHHDTLLEPLTEPIAHHVAFIVANKPANEIVVRLTWLRPVRLVLPDSVAKACADYDKAWGDYNKAYADYNKACADYNKARDDYDKAWGDYNKAWGDYNKAYADLNKAHADLNKARKVWRDFDNEELEAIHARELPGCPWDGKLLVFRR